MSLRLQLVIFMFLRTILNTMHRMVYPFLAVFARGLGVDIATLSLVVTARSFFGMFAPIFGSIADHRGRRFGMFSGIFLFTVGMGLVAIVPSFLTFSIALLLAILGKYLFDPSMQAYFGDRIPYEKTWHRPGSDRRVMVIGVHRRDSVDGISHRNVRVECSVPAFNRTWISHVYHRLADDAA